MVNHKRKKVNSTFEAIFLLFFSVIIFIDIMSLSQLSENSAWGRINTVASGLCLLVIMISFFLLCEIDKNTMIIGTILCILTVLIWAKSDKGQPIIFFTAIAFFGIFTDQRKIIKRYIYIASFTVALIILLYYTGFFHIETIGRTNEDVTRLYLGFTYTTTAPQFLFYITTAYFFIKKKGINILETIIILALNFVLYKLTDTNVVFYGIIAYIAVLWVIRLFPLFFKLRVFKIITTWIMPILAIVNISMTIIYSPSNNILSKINTMFSGRLMVAKNALDRYGLHPFGTKTEWIITQESRADGTYMNVDSSYLSTSISFGFIILILIIIGFMIIARNKHKEGHFNACISLIFLSVLFFTDVGLFQYGRNPLIILLGAAYYYRGKMPISENTGEYPMEHYLKNEREIKVRTVFWHVLKKWYIILIVAAIIGAIASGYRLAKNYSKTGDETEVALAQEAYQKKLDEYKRNQETYKKTIDDMENTLQSKLDYLSKSELIKIDPNKEQIASISMYFTSNGFNSKDTETDNTANKIIDQYGSFISSGIDYTDLSKKLDIAPVYISELVSTVKDYSTGSFTITAKSNDAMKSREILEYTIAQTDRLYDSSRQTFGDFSVRSDMIREKEVIDNSLQNTINTKANEIKNLETSIKQIKQSLEKLDKPSEPAILGRSAVIKDALVFGAKAFSAGVAGMILLMALIIIGRRRVLSVTELNKAYDLKEVAVITKRSDDLSDKYDIASENIIKYSDGAQKILLVGDAPEKQTFDLMSELQERLPDMTFDRLVRIDDNKDNLEKFKNADAIVFVEKVGRSSYRLLDKNYDFVNNWGKKIIGSVVV